MIMDAELQGIKDAFGALGAGGKSRYGKAMGMFDLIDIAEEEILAAIVRTPERAQELNATFSRLNPPPGMSYYTSTIYRAYCREVLHLVATDQTLVYPTDAELLVALCETSQKAPLDGTTNCLYMRLFNQHLEGIDGISAFAEDGAEFTVAAAEHLYGKQADVLYEKLRAKGR